MMRRIVGSSFSNFSLLPVSWKKVLKAIRGFFQRSHYTNALKGVIGSLVELETAIVFKDFLNSFGSSCLVNKDVLNFSPNLQEDFFLKLNLEKLSEVDFFLFLGLNLRLEFPILNSRLRGLIVKNNKPVFSFGQKYNLTYSYKQLGTNNIVCLKFMEGKHFLNNFILRSKNIKVLLGANILNRVDGLNIFKGLKLSLSFIKSFSNLSVVNNKIAFNGLNQIGFFPGKYDFKQVSKVKGEDKTYRLPFNHRKFFEQAVFYYLLGLKEFFMKKKKLTDFVIFQGHHPFSDMKDINILLPGITYLERGSTFSDVFGNIKYSNKIFKIKNRSQRVDWEILQMLGVYLKSKNFKVEKDFKSRLNTFFSFGTTKRLFNKEYGIFFNKENYILHNTFFQEIKYNFFLQNIITQNSINMETCSKEIYLAKRISKREFRVKRIRPRWKNNIVKNGNKLAVKASKLDI